MKHRKKVGLALGSGGFRGFAHIGVIKSLEKHGIPIDYLSGASIGSWVAAYYALFKDVSKLEQELMSISNKQIPQFLDFSWTGGFIGGQKFANFLEQNFQHRNFSNLKLPLRIVATDLVSGQPFVFDHGDIAKAVRASTSVPLVFKPTAYQGRLLVDGGLSNPVPGDLVKGLGADIVIGVNLYHKNEFIDRKFTMPKVVLRSTRIAMHNLAKVAVRSADIVIGPDTSKWIVGLGISKYFDDVTASKLIRIGEKATDKMIPQIKKLLR